MPAKHTTTELCDEKLQLVTALLDAVVQLRSLKVASIDDFGRLIRQKNTLLEQFETHLREHGC